MTVAELKKKIEQELGLPVTLQRLFLRTQELSQHNVTLLSYGIRKKSTISLRPPLNLKNKSGLIQAYENIPKKPVIKQIVFQSQEGFNLGLFPKPTLEGTSGVYFIRNSNRKNIGIFKPVDEEPFAPNNPKGYQGKLGSQGFRRGILSGEAASREVAAYLIDEKEFFGVPPTTFVEVVHPYFGNRELAEEDIEENYKDMAPIASTNLDKKLVKHGSFQKFIENAEEASDYGSNMFPEDEVHKLAILDILILNCDRNEGNILIKKDSNKRFKLIPIDHGLSFPDTIDICSYELVWTEWPQIHKPFSEKEQEFISTLNPKEDTIKLSKYIKFRDACLKNFRIASTVLIRYAKAEMTIADIANLLYKDEPDMVAPIEEIIKKAEIITETMKGSISREFLNILSQRDKKPKIAKHFSQDIILEESKEKENSDLPRLKAKSTIKSFAATKLLTDISEEPDMFDGNKNSLKVGRTTSLTEKKENSFKHTQEVLDGSMIEMSSEESLEEENSTPTKITKTIARKASMPDLTGLEEEKGEKKGDEEQADVKKSKLHKGTKKKQQQTVPSYLDDLFFYYFEEFLKQKIEVNREEQDPDFRQAKI
eukprot:CAMPEP_0176437752 /NCGR_PEP_ID=MMETSP0127-20121128/18831_1 /TAXON_ID=938130 /ORGANISM="Platyophrya macrostoma, Strain WH" /LENGTH=594 /DNA_ID=CAMNT_0017821483 /DNA_START=213 /DNA_END=1996 /DNA_ORIENTATION=-